MRLPAPPGPGAFGARLQAITAPKPIAITKTAAGQLLITVARATTPRLVQSASSLSGPWTNWQTAPVSFTAGETMSYTETPLGNWGYFRLPNLPGN